MAVSNDQALVTFFPALYSRLHDKPIFKEELTAEKVRAWMEKNQEEVLRFTALNLNNRKIRVLPPEIQQFSNVASICLIVNDNELELPAWLFQMPSLRFIRCDKEAKVENHEGFTLKPEGFFKSFTRELVPANERQESHHTEDV